MKGDNNDKRIYSNLFSGILEHPGDVHNKKHAISLSIDSILIRKQKERERETNNTTCCP